MRNGFSDSCNYYTVTILRMLFWKMFLQKKKGIQTDQIGKGKTGRSKAIELIMKVATINVSPAVLCFLRQKGTIT